MNEQTALKFYQQIKENKELNKYRLVNGLFIIKYLDEEISEYIGDFLKKGSAGNTRKTNLVIIHPSGQKFNKKKNLSTTGLGFWKEMNIKFIEKPIKEILK